MDSYKLFCFFLMVVFVSVSSEQLKKPDDMSEEMYCVGCEVTVKELDFMLSRKPTRGMGETVTRALSQVCNLNNFKKYDVAPKKVLEVCNHIKGDEGMEAVLITEYGRKFEMGKKTTYLDMTQMICGTVLKACRSPSLLDHDGEDGGITYNAETEEFSIKHGKKVRMANPVADRAKLETPTEVPLYDEKEILTVYGQDSHEEL